MPTAVTISAVSAASDTLTAAGHGLLTGDRFRVRNDGGAPPAGLAAVTDYFAIRIDTDTVKVATSSANALAGTAIDITDAGTGTHTIEYGLPYCVPRVAAAGTQIYSADDNATWSALVALHALLTGQSQSVWSGVTLADLLTANSGVTAAANQHVTVSGTGRHKHGDMVRNVSTITGSGSGWSFDSANGYLVSSGAGSWVIGIPTLVGERIKSLTFERYGDASADLTGTIYHKPKDTVGGTSLFGISVTNAAAAWVDEACNFADQDIIDGDSMWIVLTASAANLRIGEIRVTFAFP